jgi:hypothetical protein
MSFYRTAKKEATRYYVKLEKKRASARLKQEKEIQANANVDAFNSPDAITSEYGYKEGTKFHQSMMDRLRSYSAVSSPEHTNKLANYTIRGAWIGKIVSIAMTYLVSVYFYDKVMKEVLEIPLEYVKPFLAVFSVGIQVIMGALLKNIFNDTESFITRFISGFIIGGGFFYFLLKSHMYYQDLKFSFAKQENKEKVLHIDTPKITSIRKQIEIVNNQITLEKNSMTSRSEFNAENKETLRAEAKRFDAIAEEYEAMVKTAKDANQKYIKTKLGRRTRGQVYSWAKNKRAKAMEIRREIADIKAIQSPKIDGFYSKKIKLEERLSDAQNKEISSLNALSEDKGKSAFYIQLFILLFAEIDLYGFFIYRANIKNKIVKKIHGIIDKFNSLRDLTGIQENFEKAIQSVVKMVATSQNQTLTNLNHINRAILLSGNEVTVSNERVAEKIIHTSRTEGDNVKYLSPTAKKEDVPFTRERALELYTQWGLGKQVTLTVTEMEYFDKKGLFHNGDLVVGSPVIYLQSLGLN